jgi:hypothetical protein
LLLKGVAKKMPALLITVPIVAKPRRGFVHRAFGRFTIAYITARTVATPVSFGDEVRSEFAATRLLGARCH